MRRTTAAVAAALLTTSVSLGVSASAHTGASRPRAASTARAASASSGVTHEVIGHSAGGRPIVAWHLSPAGVSGPVVLLMAAMHGNEQAPIGIMRTLIGEAPVGGIDLWVVPTYNPDGVAHDNRHNADGVDLNRNFPYRWKRMTGNYDSGPRPASEPETRAMMAFLREIRPAKILSFHQPLDGVDHDAKHPAFGHAVAHALHLPMSTLNCGGACHGTMTEWYDHTFPGDALTVEYGYHPGTHRMRVEAPRELLRLFHAHLAQPHAQLL